MHRVLLGTFAAICFGLMSSAAEASLIGDQIALDVTLGGSIEFTNGTTSSSTTPTVNGGTILGRCVRATGSSQNCGSSGLTMAVRAGADWLELQLFGSTGSSGQIDWLFSDLDWIGTPGKIVGVNPPSDPRGISVFDFGDDFVHLRTSSTNYVGPPQVFRFGLDTVHVPEPASMALLALGLLGAGAAARRRA